MRDLSDTTAAIDSLTGIIFPLFGVMAVLYGLIYMSRIIFSNENPDDYIGNMLKATISIILGTSIIVNTTGDNGFAIFKYIAIGLGVIVGSAIIGGVIWFALEIKKYRDYIKKTNKLLLLSDDFLVLSTNLEKIENQILLNSNLIEKLPKKKKTYLTMLNSLLFEKNKRFTKSLSELSEKIVC